MSRIRFTMTTMTRRVAMLAIVGFRASGLAGCAGKYTGGGIIDSAAGSPKKATFGFNFELVDKNGDGEVDFASALAPGEDVEYIWAVGKGQFSYNDHGAGVKFHFDCDPMTQPPADGSIEDQVVAEFNDDFSAIRTLG